MTKNQKKERWLWELVAGIAVLITIIFFIIFGVLLAFAPEYVSGEQSGQAEFGGMWVSGGTAVDVNEPVTKDAFVGGNRVEVNETLESDAFLGGNYIAVNAPIEGSLRAGGATVIVDSEVDGNALLLGSTVWIKKNARLHGSVNILADTVIIDGEIDEELGVAASTLTINGIVRSTADIQAQTINIGSESRFSDEADLTGYLITTENGIVGEENLTYNGDPSLAPKTGRSSTLGSWVSWQVRSYAASLIVGLALILVFPRWVRHVGHSMHTKKKQTWAHGILFFLAVPTALVILAITIIGLPLAVLGALGYGILFMVGELFAGMMLGLLIMRNGKEMEKEEQYAHRGRVMLQFGVGYTVLSLMMVIPVLGWILGVLASVWGAGGMLVNHREWRARGGRA